MVLIDVTKKFVPLCTEGESRGSLLSVLGPKTGSKVGKTRRHVPVGTRCFVVGPPTSTALRPHSDRPTLTTSRGLCRGPVCAVPFYPNGPLEKGEEKKAKKKDSSQV